MTVIIFIYCLAIIAFCLAFYFAKLLSTCSQIIEIAKQAVATLSNKELDDDAKEKATQAAAIKILRGSFFLLVKFVAVFGVTLLPIWLAHIASVAEFSETIAFAMRLDVLVITTVVASVGVLLARRLLGKQ